MGCQQMRSAHGLARSTSCFVTTSSYHGKCAPSGSAPEGLAPPISTHCAELDARSFDWIEHGSKVAAWRHGTRAYEPALRSLLFMWGTPMLSAEQSRWSGYEGRAHQCTS